MEEIRSDSPPKWRKTLSYFALAAMPLSVNLERFVKFKRPIYVSPLDVLLLPLLILMLLDLSARKPWARLRLPPAPALFWAGLALLSCVWISGFPGEGTTLMDWLMAAANPLVVVMLPVWIFSNLSHDASEFRKLTLCLIGSFGVCVLVALIQYLGPVGIPFNPDKPLQALGGTTNLRLGGWYDNRMQFGAQAAMLLPVAAAFAVLDKNLIVRVLCGLMAAIGLCVTLSPGGFLGALAGVVAVAALCLVSNRTRAAVGMLIGVLAFVMLILPNLPAKRDNAGTISRGLALFAKTSEDEKKPTSRLRRYQAALDYLSERRDPGNEKTPPNWIVGAGAGRYNVQINQFYDPKYYEKPGGRTDDEAKFDMEGHERDGFGLLEKTGVELGSAGLAVLALFFAFWVAGAAGAFARADDAVDAHNLRKILALAAFGAGVGAAVVSVFAFPAQRGAGSGGSFAFLFALSAWLNA